MSLKVIGGILFSSIAHAHFSPFTSTGVNRPVPIFNQDHNLIGHANTLCINSLEKMTISANLLETNKGQLRLQDGRTLMVEAISEDGHMTILSDDSGSRLRPCDVDLTAGTGRGGDSGG